MSPDLKFWGPHVDKQLRTSGMLQPRGSRSRPAARRHHTPRRVALKPSARLAGRRLCRRSMRMLLQAAGPPELGSWERSASACRSACTLPRNMHVCGLWQSGWCQA